MKLRHLKLHGHDVRYTIEGHGPVVLLIHGMAGSSRTWTEVTRELSRHYTVIAPDMLGHGESAKPEGDYSIGALASNMRDLMAALGVETATVVGQSLGGGVAMQLAYQYPDLCERLALVGSGGLGREVNWVLRLLTLPGAELVMPALFPAFARDYGNRVSAFLQAKGVRAPHVAEIWRAYSSLVDPDTRQSFIRTLRAVVNSEGQAIDATDRLYLATAIPTLIAWGDQDDIIPVEHAYAAHERIPGSRLEIFEGAGHFLHAEQPMRFARLLNDFIESTDPAQIDSGTFRERIVSGVA